MASFRIGPPERPLSGSVPVPADRSITLAALTLAALGSGVSRLSGLEHAAPLSQLIDDIGALGIEISAPAAGELRVRGNGLFGFEPPRRELAVSSLEELALVLGALSGQRFEASIVHEAEFSRETEAMVDALAARGARCRIDRRANGAGFISLQARASEQRLASSETHSPRPNAPLKNALLVSGLLAAGPTLFSEPLVSADHVERLLSALGMPIESEGSALLLHPPKDADALAPFEHAPPGDPSAAGALLVAAQMVADSRLVVRRVSLNKTRSGLYQALRLAAADVASSPSGEVLGEPFGDISARASRLRPLTVNAELALRLASDLPLCLPLAARANGQSEIETPDPKCALSFAELLSSFGVPASADGSELRVEGSAERPLRAANVTSSGDAGLVLAACALSLGAVGESTIGDVDCIVERFPRFAGTVRALGGRITVLS